jgi:hypothetical protein
MKITRLLSIAVLVVCAAAGTAGADPILPGAPILGAATFSQFGPYESSYVSGTLNDTGVYGSVTASDTTVPAPSVSLVMDLEPYIDGGYCCSGGGAGQSTMTYQAEYYVPGGDTNQISPGVTLTTITTLTSNPSVSSVDPSSDGNYPGMQIYMTIVDLANNVTVLQVNTCLEGASTSYSHCESGFNTGFPTLSFPVGGPTLQTINLSGADGLDDNTPYEVFLGAYGGGIGLGTAILDPTFSTTDTNGSFVFSDGIGNSEDSSTTTPEPATWASMLIGLGLLAGLRLRR